MLSFANKMDCIKTVEYY